MVDANEPKTFWADLWRFARERMAQRLPSPFKSFLTSGLALTLSLILGGFLFGATFILDEAEEYVAELLALASVLLAWPVVFLFYLLSAPSAMWRRDQEEIARLQSSLVPALRLEFHPDECIKRLHRGSYTQSVGGERWYSVTGAADHILVECRNTSHVRVEGVEAHVVSLKTPPGSAPGPGFFEPVPLTTPSRAPTGTAIDLPPGGRRFFSVVVQVSEYSRPSLTGEGQPFDYEFLFTGSGTYEIRIEAHGQGTAVAAIVLEFELERREKVDATGRRYSEYEIRSVRQKDVA